MSEIQHETSRIINKNNASMCFKNKNKVAATHDEPPPAPKILCTKRSTA